ncbi:MAG: rod shape-determining protein MreD [candidate division Zixibacteria bacterium]|nr:rod shape-determining protein MreD [candidate division Zixibacteria bacterium]
MNKIQALKFIFSALFVVFYDVIIVSRLSIAGVQADMAIVITVWIALNLGPKAGTLFGFSIGILTGVLTPSDLGWAALILSLIGYSAGSLKNKLAIEPVSVQLVILLAASFIFNLLFIFTTSFGLILSNPSYVLTYTLYSALYSTFIGVFVFYLIRYRYILRNLF